MKKLVPCYELIINDTNDGVNVCIQYSLFFYKREDAVAYAENNAWCGCAIVAKCADPDDTMIF